MPPRLVLLSWDPRSPGFWLEESFPEILIIDREIFPGMAELQRALGKLTA